jgi:hypothetical protein
MRKVKLEIYRIGFMGGIILAIHQKLIVGGDSINREDRIKRFFSEQDNLNAIYWLMKGFSYREVGEKIGRPHSFVQRVNNFLRNHGLTTGRQWRIDVNAMKMTKTYKFYDFDMNGRPDEVKDNDDFLTYFADIKKGKSGHFALYTFPNEVNPKIGEDISPSYILVPKFKAPIFQSEISWDEFKQVYERENNENPLPLRGEPIDPDIIHIDIAQYVEILDKTFQYESTDSGICLGVVNLSALVDTIKHDIKEEGLEEKVDVTYDIVRNRYNEMVEKNIIYPGFGLSMRELGYAISFCWIQSSEIYRVIKAFAKFNVITALAYTKKNKYLLHFEYPKEKEIEIFEILNNLDPKNEVFKVLKTHNNRALPHPYYFEKEKKKKI